MASHNKLDAVHTAPSPARIPEALLPRDGRFGCGPSKIRNTQLDALHTPLLMGTSHRQSPVKNVVHEVRERLTALFGLPEDWTVALGNGGATTFWACACTSLIRQRSAHAVFGEFGQKFADESAASPFLLPPVIVSAPAGEVAVLDGSESSTSEVAPDVFAYPHHETSTGAISPLQRIQGVDPSALTVVDATSVAGGVDVDVTCTDVYYFSPQKCFASDGGLWFALMSPAAQERAEHLHRDAAATGRWMPQILDLSIAVKNSSKDQTLNTPAIATLVMMREQLRWMQDQGGLTAMWMRTHASSQTLYQWAEASPLAQPFIRNPQWRSPVVVTIDFDPSVDAAWLASSLRATGVVDVEPYRKLGRNQLRVGVFPSVDSLDAVALTHCLDWLLEHR